MADVETSTKVIEELQSKILELVAAAKDAGMEWMVHFGEFDEDGDSSLSLEEFKEGLLKLGVDDVLVDAGVGALFETRDWSKDGRISKSEFDELMCGKAAKPAEKALAADEATFVKVAPPSDESAPAPEKDTEVEDL
eukprot:TRINITY_DN59347_c0_g1_i1.p1 TRINITY_DN59347_c0_g1~~TRINITY_DN59347_c0_g1_i1.p1  ORF type:complete len:137 (+),score=47.41 TRINITY_DN59347_c0_g1_i1:87-497(+)